MMVTPKPDSSLLPIRGEAIQEIHQLEIPQRQSLISRTQKPFAQPHKKESNILQLTLAYRKYAKKCCA
jgi:hypothetical protein